MSGCINDQDHVMGPTCRTNELGQWRDCIHCRTTLLTPTFRYRMLLWRLRLRRRVRSAFAAPTLASRRIR